MTKLAMIYHPSCCNNRQKLAMPQLKHEVQLDIIA